MDVVYVFGSSLVGMISGAVVAYFGGVAVFAILSNIAEVHRGCGGGMFVGLMLIISGAIIGSVSGSAIAIKHPLYKCA